MKKENCLAYSQMKDRDPALYGYAPAYEGSGTEELIDSFSAYHSYYVLEHGATEKDFTDYCKKLELYEFRLVSEKKVNGQSFAIYTDNNNIVNVSYIHYRDVDNYVISNVSYVLIAVDNTNNSTIPCKCGTYEEITTIQVSMVNVLLAYIVRLADGRFLVIDSGLKPASDRIYEELCRQNVRAGKPVVAAWLFSHPHCDHVDGFVDILKRYSDSIEVQNVIHNFPGESTYCKKNYMEYRMGGVSDSITNVCNRIRKLMAEKMPNGKFTVAHAGQTFFYPGVTVEVLLTAENLYRQQMFDTNMSSVVYRLSMPHGTMLFLGDAVDVESKILRKIYGKALKSDAVVLAHHAVNGGDEELYHNIEAKAAVWPNFLEVIFGDRNLLCHYTNHFDYHSVKYNFIMSKTDPTMTLYHGMSPEEIAHFAPKFDVPRTNFVRDFACRKNPKNFLTEKDLVVGYGNAPRYYGAGEKTETLVRNPAEKTYEITLNGVTAYNFEYYCNTLKRAGYWPQKKQNENGMQTAHYASPLNAVDVVFSGNAMKISVGCAGVGALHREHE